MEYGTITKVEIGTNKDGDEQVRLATVEVYENDPITVELRSQPGSDVFPVAGSIVFFGDITDTYSLGVAGNDPTEPDTSLDEGEKEVYSYDGTERKAKTRWKKDGTQVLNDGSGLMIEFNRMKTAFDALKADLDRLVFAYNGHVHPVVGATTSTTISQGATSTADMSDAKSDTLNIP